jgi:hypothetical protein
MMRVKQHIKECEKLEIKNTYGCEVVRKRELPGVVYKVISKMRLPNPIKVPERKRGMTSSGKELQCHSNVNALTERYKGKRMLGYMVGTTRDKVTLFSHSVWITPENKMCDVTKKTENQKKTKPNQKDLDYQYFIPIVEISNKEIALKDVGIHKNYKRYGYMCGFNEEGDLGNFQMHWDNLSLKHLVGEEKVFYEKDLDREGMRDDDIESLKNGRKEEMENLFSLPSLSTGKRFSIDASSIKTPLIFTRKIKR